MKQNGVKAVVMEVSSQGLKMERVSGIVFDYAIFTNLSRDHIGACEHADMEEYRACKQGCLVCAVMVYLIKMTKIQKG